MGSPPAPGWYRDAGLLAAQNGVCVAAATPGLRRELASRRAPGGIRVIGTNQPVPDARTIWLYA